METVARIPGNTIIRYETQLTIEQALRSMPYYETDTGYSWVTVLLRDWLRDNYRVDGPIPDWPKGGFEAYVRQLSKMFDRRLKDWRIVESIYMRDDSLGLGAIPADISASDKAYLDWHGVFSGWDGLV